MMPAFTRRQVLGWLAAMVGALLVAAMPVHAAKCIPDPDSASYQDPSAAGYNDQHLIDMPWSLTGQPYFGVALNTPPLSSGDSSLKPPDPSRNETIPPQSWWMPSLVLTWDHVPAAAEYRILLFDPPYHRWTEYDLNWFSGTNSRTVPNHTSMQAKWYVRYRESADDVSKDVGWVLIRCGMDILSSEGSVRASFSATAIAPHASSGEPEYGDRYLAWNREVDRILAERQETPPTTVPTAPLAPQNLTGVGGDGEVVLSWDPPRSNGGASITDYQYRIDGSGDWISIGATDTTHTVSGLVNGTTYTFEVRAVNVKGEGAVAEARATPATAPLAPVNLTATPGNRQVTLAWTAGGDGGSKVTRHQYRQQAGSGGYGPWADIPGGAQATRFTVTGLVNGTTYTFEVRAINAEGAGAVAKASATLAATAPLAPVNLTATPGNRQVTLAWTAGDDGGSRVTRHQYRQQAGSSGYGPWTDIPSGANATRFTVTGLANGTTYTFEVRAVNAEGAGAVAKASATPATAPLAPQNLTATPGEGQVTLNWTAGDDGGSAVTRHQYRQQAGSGDYDRWTDIPGGANATRFAVTGLVNGTTYTFEVRAVNAEGAGAVAKASATLAAIAPLAPQNLTATPGESQVTLAWSAGGDGGSRVTKHQYRQQAGSGGYGPWTDIPGGANAARFTVTGLTNGTTYTFEVRAVNAEGAGAAAKTSATLTATVPLAPANLTAIPGEGQVTLVWTAGDDGGSRVTRHQYRQQAGSGGYGPWIDIPGGANTTRFTVTGLVNGTTYAFEVRAVNAEGAGAVAKASATPVAPAAWRWGWRHWGGWWPRMQ